MARGNRIQACGTSILRARWYARGELLARKALSAYEYSRLPYVFWLLIADRLALAEKLRPALGTLPRGTILLGLLVAKVYRAAV